MQCGEGVVLAAIKTAEAGFGSWRMGMGKNPERTALVAGMGVKSSLRFAIKQKRKETDRRWSGVGGSRVLELDFHEDQPQIKRSSPAREYWGG